MKSDSVLHALELVMLAATTEQIVKEMKAHPFTLLAVLGLIAFAIYSHVNHASAEDISQVNDKIERSNAQIERILKLQLAEGIRGLTLEVCHAKNDAQKRILLQTIDDLQQDYEDIAGSRYPVPACPATTASN